MYVRHQRRKTREEREASLRVGRGRSIAQFGELFQGEVEDDRRVLHKCLISLPCKRLISKVTLNPDTSGILTASPAHKKKALETVRIALLYLNSPGLGGSLTIESNIPEAKGCGSSTADCVAAAIAAADAVRSRLSEEELARLVVDAEIASDSFMFRQAVLFAHREGLVLERFDCPMPKLEVLGIDSSQDDYVHTLEYPPAAYSWRQHESFRTLTCALRRAILHDDVRLLGRVATASACVNEAFLPKPGFNEIRRIAECAGALGVGVAHSGTMLSILFDAQDESLERRVSQVQRELETMRVSIVLRFRT